MNRARLVLAAAAVALVFPQVGTAHPILEHTAPGIGERVRTVPREVVLRFSEPVAAFPGSINVRNTRGRLVSAAQARDSTTRVLRARLIGATRGGYTVRWRTISDEGHAVSGVFTFGVGRPAPPLAEAFGSAGPTTSDHILRWLYFVGLALLLGGIGFRLFVAGGDDPAAKASFFLCGVGGVLAIEAGLAGFLLRAQDALQVPFPDLLYSDLSPFTNHTRFGFAFIAMTLALVSVVTLVFLGWVTGRREWLWPAFVLSLALASGLSYASHAATNGAVAEIVDWVHLVAAMLWLGGLMHLALWSARARTGARKPVFLRFSRLVTATVAVLVPAGVYLASVRLSRLSDLWTQGYGRVLVVKAAIAGVALAWGAFHRFVIGPTLARPGGERLLRFIPRSVAGEASVAVAALLLAAVLVDSNPPR